MAKKPDIGPTTIEIEQIQFHRITFHVVGRTPFIFHRISADSRKDLMMPPPKKNAAEKAQTLKHDPIAEFRATPYYNRSDAEPALFHVPEGALKRCIAQAALDIPGATKAQVGRWVTCTSTQVNMFGLPYLRADMVRMADKSRTPDVRFRCCLPEWALEVTFEYPDWLAPRSVANMFAAAGVIVGIGDYRVEKGAGDNGKFAIVGEDDEDWHRIVAEGGREAQVAAMQNPLFYDDEARELITWFDTEIERRRKMPTIARSSSGKSKPGEAAGNA